MKLLCLVGSSGHSRGVGSRGSSGIGITLNGVSDDVQRQNNDDKDDREPLGRAGEERVIGTRLVLREEGVRTAGNNADALLVTFLQNNNNNQYNRSDQQKCS